MLERSSGFTAQGFFVQGVGCRVQELTCLCLMARPCLSAVRDLWFRVYGAGTDLLLLCGQAMLERASRWSVCLNSHLCIQNRSFDQRNVPEYSPNAVSRLEVWASGRLTKILMSDQRISYHTSRLKPGNIQTLETFKHSNPNRP